MLSDPRFDGYRSYIMSSNVEYLMSVGARVVPLIRDEPQEVTDAKLDKLDAVLFPGGDGNYSVYGQYVYEKIVQKNEEGTYFPLMGICMGF